MPLYVGLVCQLLSVIVMFVFILKFSKLNKEHNKLKHKISGALLFTDLDNIANDIATYEYMKYILKVEAKSPLINISFPYWDHPIPIYKNVVDWCNNYRKWRVYLLQCLKRN
jgi:hypothetical protein